MVLPWLLGDFAKDDAEWLEPALDGLARYLPLLLAGAFNDYLRRIADAMPKPDRLAADGE